MRGTIKLTMVVKAAFGLAPWVTALGCAQRFGAVPGEVRLITLDPGHFHAALVQKTMYPHISPTVHVYAPTGDDLDEHLRRIAGFNTRPDGPTAWQERVYSGPDYLERLLAERAGNVVVIAGNNRRKAEYIQACLDGGLNVLADKPMCIDAAGYRLISEALVTAERRGLLLYDLMTERSEITSVLQRELARDPGVFGELDTGSPNSPAVEMESVHYFCKTVAGAPLRRPAWYFDTTQQGEGLVDVTTHLIDLVMWTCFPDQSIRFDHDVLMIRARRWPTVLTRTQLERVTGLPVLPEFLQQRTDPDGSLRCYANGDILFVLRGRYVLLTVRWDFESAAGAGDRHYARLRGTRANLVVRQGADEHNRPELYVEPGPGVPPGALRGPLEQAVKRWQARFPGVACQEVSSGWRILIPDQYRVGHEAHFREVVERYLKYLADRGLPPWEASNLLTKYRITTTALEMARQ